VANKYFTTRRDFRKKNEYFQGRERRNKFYIFRNHLIFFFLQPIPAIQ